MFQAVIFDFGGVITESPFEAFARLEQEKNIPPRTIRSINATNPDHNAWAKFERAEIDLNGFDEAFASEAKQQGFDLRGREVMACLQGNIRPKMLTALRKISNAFKTGCITNNVKNEGSTSNWRVAAYDEAMSLFVHVLESSKVGLRKPDPRIYQMMTDMLSVPPQNCIYLDDLGINLKPAKALGMTTIKVENPDLTIAELERHLRLPLS